MVFGKARNEIQSRIEDGAYLLLNLVDEVNDFFFYKISLIKEEIRTIKEDNKDMDYEEIQSILSPYQQIEEFYNNLCELMFNLIKDNKVFVSLADAMLSIFILLMVLMALNMMIDIEIPSLSEESNDFKTSQDIMEIMSSKVDGRDYTVLERITYILSENNNSIASRREVKAILDELFMVYFDDRYHYSFVETNQLNGEILSSNGDYSSSRRVNVAIRNYGNYSYKLYVF